MENKSNYRKPTGNHQNEQRPEKPYEPLQKENYVQRAEKVIKALGAKSLSTSQIRNILSMLSQIYNDVIVSTDETLSEEIQSQLRYLKVKLIYAAGREQNVKAFIEMSQIDRHLDKIGNSREQFILYSRYMEALVAYHKFYNSND